MPEYNEILKGTYFVKYILQEDRPWPKHRHITVRSLRLSVRTPGFQPGKRGSIPLGTASDIFITDYETLSSGTFPEKNSLRFLITRKPIASRVSLVALPKCGNNIALGQSKYSLFKFGSSL